MFIYLCDLETLKAAYTQTANDKIPSFAPITRNIFFIRSFLASLSPLLSYSIVWQLITKQNEIFFTFYNTFSSIHSYSEILFWLFSISLSINRNWRRRRRLEEAKMCWNGHICDFVIYTFYVCILSPLYM